MDICFLCWIGSFFFLMEYSIIDGWGRGRTTGQRFPSVSKLSASGASIPQSFGGWWLEGDGDRGDGGMDSQRTQVGDASDNVLTHLARRYVCAVDRAWGRGHGGWGSG